MAGLKQSKRVSWAPDVKLCQVRLFLSEDTPSQSGSAAQDHLQAKTSWLQHSRDLTSDESLPPGFEAALLPYQFNRGISQIPVIKWSTPIELFLNREWLVVAGEESEEVGLQNQRQLGVFEAIYPRPSSIPPNPISSDVQETHYDDAQTPLIPMTAIEEDPSDELDLQAALDPSRLVQHADAAADVRIPTVLNLNTQGPAGNRESCASDMHTSEKPAVSFVPSVEPDVVAAASAAFTALIRSSEEGSLIDRDLLIKILSNPNLIEKLMAEHEAPRQQHPPHIGATSASPVPPPVQPNLRTSLPAPQMAQFQLPQRNPIVMRPPTNPQPSPVGIQVAANPPVSGPPFKNISYFKTLIQQHGGDQQQEVLEPNHVPFDGHRHYPYKAVGGNNAEQGIQCSVPRDPKPKIPKPCMYFNGPRGCRRGADCLYVHEASLPQTIERQSRKKIKLDKETSRRV
ncbi:hypothetical protein Taro_031822 [Colocasia esculenta]|uniref:C3H1-type domain-containing protein n=1 Tax=Colocasia esculenta TaxID=4460 RepID=A0A843VR19_COLES|nr:hypothetical protein [Colocasia esculenta]